METDVPNSFLKELNDNRIERQKMRKNEKQMMYAKAKHDVDKAKQDAASLANIKTIFDKITKKTATNALNEIDEIFIFKSKYNEMIETKQINKATFVTPMHPENSIEFDIFMACYVFDLSDDQRRAVINKYGEVKAINLLSLWQKNLLKMSKEEIHDYFESTTVKGIESDIVRLIFNDAIGAHVEWMHS
jgi:hypothetical protein